LIGGPGNTKWIAGRKKILEAGFLLSLIILHGEEHKKGNEQKTGIGFAELNIVSWRGRWMTIRKILEAAVGRCKRDLGGTG
jgi:hypothetical protein